MQCSENSIDVEVFPVKRSISGLFTSFSFEGMIQALNFTVSLGLYMGLLKTMNPVNLDSYFVFTRKYSGSL